MSVVIVATGLQRYEQYFQVAPALFIQAARMALNDKVGTTGLARIRTKIGTEVNFPTGYLNSGNKLFVKRKAFNDNLEVVLAARARATSLARFTTTRSIPESRKAGVSVTVHPGQTRRLKKSFLVRLKAGASLTEDNYNLGLAIRLKPGETLSNKKVMGSVQLGHNLYLLYGPSVDQVFRTAAVDETPGILDDVESEFLRQFARLSDQTLGR